MSRIAAVAPRWARSVIAIPLLGFTGCFPDKLTLPTCTPVAATITATNADTVTTSTGLRYIESISGQGPVVAWCHDVAVRYNAYLTDGTEFDETRTTEQPLLFTPGYARLIDGLEQGVIGMRVGGTRRLIVTPALGFGAVPRKDPQGNVVVPANSTLIYDIEIIQVIP